MPNMTMLRMTFLEEVITVLFGENYIEGKV